MTECVVKVVLVLAVFSVQAMVCTVAQDCNDLVTITSSGTDVPVNTSISRFCLQCVDGNMVFDPNNTIWEINRVTVTDSTPGVVQVAGVLVLLDPMQLLMDGGVTLVCSDIDEYIDIQVFSSTLLPPVVESPVARTFTEGDNARVVCDDLNPSQLMTELEWLDPHGNRAPANRGLLLLPSITRTQAGQYHCVLTSITNDTVSATVTITVQYSPDVTSQNPTSVQALPGTNVTLSCDFTGVPSPDVTWSHDGVVTAPGQGVAIVTRGNRSEFTVQGVTGERGGVYRCSVSNSIGSGSFNFTVETVPDPPTTLTTSTSETSEPGNTVTTGDSGSSGGSGAITAGIVVTMVIILLLILGIGTILVILFIRKRQYFGGKEGWVAGPNVLMFQNEHGHSGDHAEETFSTEEEPPKGGVATRDGGDTRNDIPLVELSSREGIASKEPKVLEYKKKMEVCEGKQVTLRVMFTGTPKPTVTWTRNGGRVMADYSTEICADGSIFIVCVEKKHAGRYNFEVSNRLGSVMGNITLGVKEEEEEDESATNICLETNPVKVEEFGEYVAEMHTKNNQGFVKQFQAIPTGEGNHSSSVGKEIKNKPLNRFKNILPYNDHCIRLQPFDERSDCQHEYVNASSIAFLQPKAYIASQGPLPDTIIDFWRMIWQEGVGTISMVTNLYENCRIKCERYWPDMGSEQHGPFKVTLVQKQTFADYIIRELQMVCLEKEEEPRKITHYHFTSWPDHGVPEYAGPMLNFLKKMKTSHGSGPLLVHCSAGVGRTGTLLAIDMILTQAPTEGSVDVPRTLTLLRQQRMKMVQTADQYVFIHDAVLESLSCGDTQIVAKELVKAMKLLEQTDEHTGKTGYDKQFQVLGQVSPKDNEVVRTTALKYPDKNRSTDFLPSDKWRCCLRRQMPDYINASYADGYKQKKGFLIAQAPMQSTTSDFWRLISDKGCGVIVMLSELEEEGSERCVQYWPTEGDSTEYGEFLVTTVKLHKNEGYTQRVLNVTSPKSRRLQKVVQFQLKGWTAEGLCSNPGMLIEVIDHMTVIQRKSGNKPILVHGRDTVSRVGVFCSLVNAIELCKTEGSVDIFQVLKALRIQKPGSVQTVEQYRFIFDVILVFLNSFSIYSNFK